MIADNCIDTIHNNGPHHVRVLSWGDWLADGRTLLAIEAARPFRALVVFQRRAQARRQMMEMDERMLRDIGADRADIMKEAAKPFWRE